MNINKKLKTLQVELNDFQKEFISNTEDLFSKVNKNTIAENSYVEFNTKNNIIEISLVHQENYDSVLLFLIHENFIEIGCLEYTYYFDFMDDSLFKGLMPKDKSNKIHEIVDHMLSSKYKLLYYSLNGKIIKNEIIWDELNFLNQRHNRSIFGFILKPNRLDKKEKRLKSFIN